MQVLNDHVLVQEYVPVDGSRISENISLASAISAFSLSAITVSEIGTDNIGHPTKVRSVQYVLDQG